MKTSWLLGAWLLIAGLPAWSAETRTWTKADDGKTIEAEYVSSADGKVTILRSSDRRSFTLDLSNLSEEDREWVSKQEAAAEEEAMKADENNSFVKLLTGDWERSEGHGQSFRLFGERRLRRPTEEGYPLVIYLHGRGGDVMTPDQPGDARQFSEEKNYQDRRCFILAPQCTAEGGWSGANADAVIEIVEDLVKNLNIDKNRIYLTGYSMGAYGTFHLLAQEPKLFAAGVPVAGGGNPSTAGSFKKVPVWVFHGAKDEVVKVEQSQNMVEALKDARGDVTYTEFPDDGHGISGKVFNDVKVHEWLFAQSRK